MYIGIKFIIFWLGLLASSHGSALNVQTNGFSESDGGFYTDDAVILNAAARVKRHVTNSTRDGKQVFVLLQPRQTDRAIKGDCETARNDLGVCKSFDDCYPIIKEVYGSEEWVKGFFKHFESCQYTNEENLQVFGVCCTEPEATREELVSQQLAALLPAPPVQIPPVQYLGSSSPILSALSRWSHGNGNNFRQIPAQWPPTIPPLPTHPPDHTAPTHPPSLVAGVTTKPPNGRPTTTWATKPPSTTKQTWAPAYPTKPIAPAKPTLPSQPAVDGSCGIKNGPQAYESTYQDEERIVGGHNAELNEWPWIVALFNAGRQFCGGSLMDDKHVLSAAHCVAHMTSWDVARLTARLGDYNIRTNSETQHIERKIKRVVRHRGFDMRTLYNDVAVLTLDQPVSFTNNIRPICMPYGGRASYQGKVATVIGWGSLQESGPQPSVLQEVSIPIWSNKECQLKYGGAAPGGIVEHMLCAGKASMDSCSGDSGGPLMVNENGRWTQVGIVSWGIGCGKGQYPGVYTRVTYFMPWIQKNSK